MWINPSRIIWLGDLNYRVTLSYDETRVLVEDNDWDTLLENDQVCKTLHFSDMLQWLHLWVGCEETQLTDKMLLSLDS